MSTVAQYTPTPPEPLTQSGSSYVSNNGDVEVQFTQDASGNNVMQFTDLNRDTSVSWLPQVVKYVDSNGLEDVVYSTNNDADLFVTRNYSARYDGHFPDVEEYWTVQAGQVKHYATLTGVMREPLPFLTDPQLAIGGILEFDPSFSIRTMGMNMSGDFTTSEALEIVDSSDQVVFTLPPIEVWDQDGNRTGGTYSVTMNGAGSVYVAMCVDYTWLSQDSIVYPVVIDPTVIVSSAMNPSTGSGRRLVELSNGWILSLLQDTSVNPYALRVYVSKDGSNTWAQLCYIQQTTSGSGDNLNDAAMVSTGTQACVIASWNNNSVLAWTFDATTVTNTNLYSSFVYVDQNATALGPHLDACLDPSGNIHATWCSRTSAIPNSYNIRYAKSTNSGSSWTTATYCSSSPQNTSGSDDQYPCIVVNGSNNPVIIYAHNDVSSSYDIGAWYFDGTTWHNETVYAINTNQQKNPKAVLDPTSGYLHVVWQGTVNSIAQILYTYSTDGGQTWAPVLVLTNDSNTQAAPTIAIDTVNRNLYVFWQGIDSTINSSYYQIREIVRTMSTNSWSNETSLTSQSSANANAVQVMISTGSLYYMWQDSQASKVDIAVISVDSAPNAPILGSVPNFDASTANTFTWTFSDPDPGDTQSAFELKIIDVSTGDTVVDTGKVVSVASNYTLPANTLTNGKQYQWAVATWDAQGVEGSYSQYGTFNTAAVPTVQVTFPSQNAPDMTSHLTVQWNYSDPGNNAQATYDVTLEDVNSNVLYDSGSITDPNGTARAYTIPYTLANNSTYQVKVAVTNSQGVAGTSSLVEFTTNFTAPQQPTLNTTPIPTSAKITLAMTNYVSTNLVLNSGFEVVTTTAQLFNDALTSYTGSSAAPWTLRGGSFTFGSTGATSTALGSSMSAGNSAWSPILGSDGSTKLSLTAQATFTTPSTIPSSGTNLCYLQLYRDVNDRYKLDLDQGNNTFVLQKCVAGTFTNLSSVSVTPAASTSYTMTMSLDPAGNLTAKLYSGTSATGTPLQTLTATDTSLTGGFLIAVGGDTGVVITNAQVTGPWSNGWTVIGHDTGTIAAWSLTTSAYNGDYSATVYSPSTTTSYIGHPEGTSGMAVTGGGTYTVSAYVDASAMTSGSAGIRFLERDSSGNLIQDHSIVASANAGQAVQRIAATITTQSTTAYVNVRLELNGAGTALFDCIQLERSWSSTPYIENDSTTAPVTAPGIAYNDVYRRNTGTTAWTRIATQVNSSGTYDDYAVASGQGYDYKITAIGNNGTQIDSQVVTNQSIDLSYTGTWIHDVSDPAGTILNLPYYNNSMGSTDGTTPNGETYTPNAETIQVAGRTLPIVEFGENYTYSLNKGSVVCMTADGTWPILENLIRNTQTTLCIRDGRGKSIFGNIIGYTTSELVFGTQVDLSLQQTSYSIAV